MKKYGLMTYPAAPEYNVGDYIQSLAAKQYLPRVDQLINREQLSIYNDEDVDMIMNGWYMHRPQMWPPTNHINPLFVSFHLNSNVKDRLLSPEGVAYFKQHEPIGCRDLHTMRSLEEKGIKTYHSGCLTTTLDINYKAAQRTENIYFADVLFNIPGWRNAFRTPREFVKSIVKGDILHASRRNKLLKALFTKELLDKSIDISHKFPAKHSEEQRFQTAEDLLNKFATAKFVVTSRIHSALPCLALGTPVIFVKSGFLSYTDLCRFEGITDLFNTINIDNEGNVQANFDLPEGKIGTDFNLPNPVRYKDLADKLKEKCRSFIG